MKTMHTLEQIIDLEYFLHLDRDQSPEELHQRDRQLALQLENENAIQKDSPAPKELLAGWLHLRLKESFGQPRITSPGSVFRDSRSLATTLITLKGLLAGTVAGWAFFAYAGTTPINVLQFLLFFVATQLVVIALLLAAFALRKVIPEMQLPSGPFFLLHRLGSYLFARINKEWYSKMSSARRASVFHAFGIIKSKSKTYGTLFYWPLFTLAQLFGITFNIGLLAATLIKITTSDLAFGWQSTIQFSNEAIFRLVNYLALPWSWFLPQGTGIPTLSEIEGSHIILKDGIYNLATENLVAWWPFLICCVLFYGLLIRLALFLLGKVREKRDLATLRFTTPQCSALLRRMTTPIVTTQAIEEAPKSITKSRPAQEPQQQATTENILSPGLVFIPDEIYGRCPDGELEKILNSRGCKEQERYRFMVGYDEDLQLLEELKSRVWQGSEVIFIIMEGWMVPLVDFIVFLGELRTIASSHTPIEIALTGKEEQSLFTDVSHSDFTIWRQKIEAIGDPYIHITPIKGVESKKL